MEANRFIAKCIIAAQVASDAGKYIYSLSSVVSHCFCQQEDKGYLLKDKYIYKAVETIRVSKTNIFNYSVTIGDIENSFIIYFNMKINGKRYQASFHSFNKKLWKKYVAKSNKTTWDEKDSRQSCLELAKQYNFIKKTK